MSRRNYAFTPMTLGNIRKLGVRSLAVTCELCHHESVLPADRWPDETLVSTFLRMVCACCGIVGADARPNWREMKDSEIGCTWGPSGWIKSQKAVALKASTCAGCIIGFARIRSVEHGGS